MFPEFQEFGVDLTPEMELSISGLGLSLLPGVQVWGSFVYIPNPTPLRCEQTSQMSLIR
jgi:hypothetical protein